MGLCVGYSILVCGRGVDFHLRRLRIEAPGPLVPEAEMRPASDIEQYE